MAKKLNERPETSGSGKPAFQRQGTLLGHTSTNSTSPVRPIKTLQQYHGGPNQERTEYMELHSSLHDKNLSVSVEQVSMFVTSDNTVISFFENSADDIEPPILERLNSRDTVIRKACDASMVMQAIIDAVIDLAIPVAAAYQDAIAELELDVLTAPDIQHTQSLYILTTEIAQLRSLIQPIVSLVNALRDHKNESVRKPGGQGQVGQWNTGVNISQITTTYLGDVEDHCILITEALTQMSHAADSMIQLIFNTISMTIAFIHISQHQCCLRRPR